MTDSNLNSNTPTYSENQIPCQEEQIIVSKIYDQCRLQEYTRQGPAVSNENCVCTVIHPLIDTQTFGRLIYPGEPIRLPKWIKQIKYVKNSFQTESATIVSIIPSLVKRGFWDVKIKFVCDFDLRLFGDSLTPIAIICQPCLDDSPIKKDYCKDFLRCSTSFCTTVTLAGTGENTPVTASDIFPQKACPYPNAPHAFVEAWAKPIDFKLVEPEEAGCFINLFDDTYHEPFHYIYACIAMAANIKLFGFTSLAIEGRRITPHKKCCDIDDDPCGVFADMPFPVDLFLPKQEK